MHGVHKCDKICLNVHHFRSHAKCAEQNQTEKQQQPNAKQNVFVHKHSYNWSCVCCTYYPQQIEQPTNSFACPLNNHAAVPYMQSPMNISGFISLSRPSSSMGLDLILPSEAPFAQHRTHYMAVGIFAGCAVTCMHACVTQCVSVFETFLCSLNHFHFLSISWLHMELIYNVRTGSSTTVTQCQCHCHDKISFLVATLRKLLPLGHTAFYCPYRIIASYLSSLSLYCTD